LKNDQIAIRGASQNETTTTCVKVGTRASKLARLQTEVVVGRLRSQFPDCQFQVRLITTGGDKQRDRPIAEVGSIGVFVKELEEALLCHEVDLVVHSLKDLPTELAQGLVLAGVLAREDPRDVLISQNKQTFAQLPPNSRVATSSRRRSAQLAVSRKDLQFVDIRGNIPTRLKKHEDGQCDAIILASAGLIRLNLLDRVAEFLDYDLSLPAAGQGALGVECRSDDAAIKQMIELIEEPEVRAEITAERTILQVLGGGCSIPIGALGRANGRNLSITAAVAALDGSKIVRCRLDGDIEQPEKLGEKAAYALHEQGATEIINALKATTANIVSPP
jgi:hydroxymethylbilane synthase